MIKDFKFNSFALLFSSLKNRNFRFLLLANVCSFVSLWGQTTVLYLYILNLTNSAGQVTLVGFVSVLPLVLFGMLGGHLASKFQEKIILQTVEGFSLLSSLAIAVFLFLDLNTVWIAYIGGFFVGIRFPLIFPSFRILVRKEVKKENLTNAIALETASFQLGKVLGPIIAGFLILKLNFAYALLSGTIITLISLGLIFQIKPTVHKFLPQKQPSGKKGLFSLLKNPYLFATLFATLFFNILVFTHDPMVPILANSFLTSNAFLIGVLIASGGIGGILGSLLIALLKLPDKFFFFVFILGCFIGGIALLLFSASKIYLLSILCLIFLGIGGSMFATMQGMLVFSIAPESLQGKMFGILTVIIGGSPFGYLLLSYLAETNGPVFALQHYGIASIICFSLISIYILLTRKR